MRDRLTRVGVIGSGAIGGTVARRLVGGEIDGCELVALLARSPSDDAPAELLVRSSEGLVASSPDIVVEAASHGAVRDYGATVLETGSDLVCVSVGALADPGLRDRLADAAAAGGARLIVPSGAVGALDALRAAASGGLDHVSLEQRKPPAAVLPEGERDISEPLTVFAGSAAEAAQRFPTTMNIVAAVALAGIGFERTRCSLVADPALAGARVTLRASGGFGELTFSMASVPSSNLRTSAITAMSVASVLRERANPIPAFA